MQRLRETFRRQRQPTLEQKAQQQHLQLLQQQRQLKHQQQEQAQAQAQTHIHQQIQQQQVKLQQIQLEFQEPQCYFVYPDHNHQRREFANFDHTQTLDVPHSVGCGKQIRSVSYDEIRIREDVIGNNDDGINTESGNANTLNVPSSSRNLRSRSFDSAAAHSSANISGGTQMANSSSFLDVPKWKLLIRRSSSGSSSGGSASNTAVPYSGVKDCVHCTLMEEYLRSAAQMSPPPSTSGSFSSEGSSLCGEESDRESEIDPGESGSPGGSGGDAEEFVDEPIIPLEGLPLVTLCPPPEVHEIQIEEEEDSGSGITVVSLEVPILTGSKQIRSASVDSPYLLQVPKRTDVGDGESAPKAHRSRSVDIVLPTNPGGPYLIVPPHRPTPFTTK